MRLIHQLLITVFISTIGVEAFSANETNFKPAWVGEWILSSPESNETVKPKTVLSITEFDNALIFNSPLLSFGNFSTYLGDGCVTQKFNSNANKISFTYKECLNKEVHGYQIICEILLKSPNERKADALECAGLGTKKFFRRIQ